MDILEQIRDILKTEYKEGATQAELSKKYGISQNHVCNILSGKRSVGSMRASTLLRLFPNATINLHGDKGTISNNGTINGSVAAVNNGTINHGTITQSCFDAVTDKILKDNELTAEEKVRFLGILRK